MLTSQRFVLIFLSKSGANNLENLVAKFIAFAYSFSKETFCCIRKVDSQRKRRVERVKKLVGVLGLGLLLLLAACNGESNNADSEEKEGIVVATTGQIADAVKIIGGEHLQVTNLMGPGVDPHLYKATQSDVSKLDKAEVIFYNGLHLEGQMQDIFNKMAVQAKKKVSFQYGDYDADKNKILKNNGEVYINSPYGCLWSDDFAVYKRICISLNSLNSFTGFSINLICSSGTRKSSLLYAYSHSAVRSFNEYIIPLLFILI